MNETIILQIFIFLWSLFAGAFLGLVCDAFRVARKLRNTPDFAVILEDVFCWILAAALIVLVAFWRGGGDIRLYEFFGFFAGFLLYRKIAKDFVLAFGVKTLIFIKRIIARAVYRVIWPFIITFKFIRKPLAKFFRAAKLKSRKIAASAKVRLARAKLRAKIAARAKFRKQ